MANEPSRLSVQAISDWVPWDTDTTTEARATARRVAALIQARAFLIRVVLDREPTNTMSEGIIGMLLATNTTLVEELILGHFRHAIGRRPRKRGIGDLVTACESNGLLNPPTVTSLRKLIDARHNFVHADRGRVLPATSPRLTQRNIWTRTFHRLPIDVARELGGRQDHEIT